MGNIRSEYVKNFVGKKEDLVKQLEENSKQTIENMLTESVRNMLNEADNSYEEEEVEDPAASASDAGEGTDNGGDAAGAEGAAAAEAGEGAEGGEGAADGAGAGEGGEGQEGTGEGAEGAEAGATDGGEDGGIDWDSLEQYKDEDGEYDLSAMDTEQVVKVLKVMKPEDGVRVVKNDNGTVTLNDDETDKEYIIDIDGSMGGGNAAPEGEGAGEGAEEEFDIQIGDETNEAKQNECGGVQITEADLGYTDDYQKQTAMTTPPNNEPAKNSETYSMDGGIPTGTDKPFAGPKKPESYTKPVNEGEACPKCGKTPCECEGQHVDESSMTTSENSAGTRGVTMSHPNTDSSHAYARNAHVGGEQVRGTGEGYRPATNEDVVRIMKKANAVFAENKALTEQMAQMKARTEEILNENNEIKAVLNKLSQNLNEAVVMNYSLGRINRLMIENSTTRDEKVEIAKRFKGVKTMDDCDLIYESITAQLKARPAAQTPAGTGQGMQIAESKNREQVVETQMYQSPELTSMLSLIERMERK